MAEDRIDNPYAPGVEFDPAPTPSAATVIKLWSGGEHARAKAVAASLKLKAADVAAIAAACPGWDEE